MAPMRTSAKLLFALAFATPWLASVPRANACTAPARGYISSRQVFPADGAVSVPTNARVVVSYLGAGPTIPDHLALTTSGGVSVPVDIVQPVSESSGNPVHQSFVLTPRAPLAPSTKYLVLSDYGTLPCVRNEYWKNGMPGEPCSSIPDAGIGDGGTSLAPAAVASFTTGAGPDTTAPTLPGPLTYTATAESCGSSPCCGPYDGYSVAIAWAGASDGGGPVFYELSREGLVVLFPVVTGTGQISTGGVQGAFLCTGIKTSPATLGNAYEQFLGQAGTYQVVAVDQAGNRSAPISTSISISCAVQDGGVVTVDATPLTDAPTVTVDVGISRGDATGQPWDGLYALADSQPGKIDMASVPDTASPYDMASVPDTASPSDGSAGPVDVPVARADASSTADATVYLAWDSLPAAEDVKHAYAEVNETAPTERTQDKAGCSCRVGGGHNDAAGLAVVALGLAFVAHRRRRR